MGLVDGELLKQVMRRYATGVMVLTVPEGEGMHAVTVNSVTSVSLSPVLVLVCLEQNARSHELVTEAGIFALNILGGDQQELGKQFAYERDARFHPERHVRGEPGETGALIFEESLGWLECRVVAKYPGGDHTIFLAEVIRAAVEDDFQGPLLYFGGQWHSPAL